MPAHWGSRRLNIITGSSPIATQIPHAAGIAYAVKYRGEDAVVACWFGDGGTSEGDWHEGLNFSGIHQLPVICVCENNRLRDLRAAVEADGRGRRGRPGARRTGSRASSSTGTTSWPCYETMHAGGRPGPARAAGPRSIECKTYRFHAHTSDDDDRTYRSREEVEEAKAKDPHRAVRAATSRSIGLLDADGASSSEPRSRPRSTPRSTGRGTRRTPRRRRAMLAPVRRLERRAAGGLETTGGEAVPAEPRRPADGLDEGA